MTNTLRAKRMIAVGAAIVGSASALGHISAAHAALGHAMDSVRADRAHMAAKMTAVSTAAYTTNVLTLTNGGQVKEFAANGVVFAIAWEGPARPDLRQLLGEHFDTLQADNVSTATRHVRMALSVTRSDFVVRSGGHSGAFWGLAYLPGAAPVGVSAADLH